MKVLRVLLLAVLVSAALTSYTATAASKGKEVDVGPVDVPEKMVIQPTPEEIHADAPIDQKCSACHGANSIDAEAKPLNHFVTSRDCGLCHFNKSWVPLRNFTHMSARYRPNPEVDPTDCVGCHKTNNELQASPPLVR